MSSLLASPDSELHPPAAGAVKPSLQTYLLLLLLLVITFFAGRWLEAQGSPLRLIGVDTLLLGVAGALAVRYQSRAGLPNLIDPEVQLRQRLWQPLAIGMVFGLLDIWVWEVLVPHPPYTSLPPFTQPFPYSILLFASGALHVELLYRLLPLTLIGWFTHRWLNNRWGDYLFWMAVVLCACIEPLEQLPNADTPVVVYSLVSGLLFNLLQGWYLKKAGFLAALTIRWGHYLLWHVALGCYIEFVLLAKGA